MKTSGHMVIGIDPDSKHLTAIASLPDGSEWRLRRRVLPKGVSNARRLSIAFKWVHRVVRGYVEEGYKVHVFIESPFVSPKFINAAIPLARLNGTMLAAAEIAGATTVHETIIQDWKKNVIGHGGATKPQIEQWCKKHWRQVWDRGQEFTKAEGRQDIYDASGINRYGAYILKKINRREQFYQDHPEEVR